MQDRFLGGQLQVIAATSAFGMGVDKPDVRLVIHLEVPGSLEAYLQQAGRAGRDREPATCVLLFEPGDVDKQFRMATMGALTLRDLQALWRGLQRVPAAQSDGVEERVVTRGELARLDAVSAHFDPEDPMTDTRLTAAVSWLERAKLFTRDENHTHVFQGRPRHPTLDAAMARVAELKLPPPKADAWGRILARLYQAERGESGLTADDLAELSGDANPVGGGSRVLTSLHHMVEAGLLTAGARLSAFLAWGVPDPSRERCARLLAAQSALLDELPRLSNGADTMEWLAADPERLSELLVREHGMVVRADRILPLLRALERDGQGLVDEERSLDLRFVRRNHLAVRARRSWARVILVDDGEGPASGEGTVSDDDRRLWYVGLTRAADRLDLIVREDRPHPLLRDLGTRSASPVRGPPASPVHYALIGLDEVWIDGLGRDAGAPGHAVLETLPFGAPVTLSTRGSRTALVAEGEVIAWLTRAAAAVWGGRAATLRFVAAVRRTEEQTDPTFRSRLQCAAWWVPLWEGRWEGW